MKTAIVFLAFLFFFTTHLLSNDHSQAVTFEMKNDFWNQSPNVSLEHQSAVEINDDHSVIFSALSKNYDTKRFYHELQLGHRYFLDEYGFGLNMGWATSKLYKGQSHQFSPGVEAFTDHFHFGMNHYFPLKSLISGSKNVFIFDRVTEAFVSYRPSRKYEFILAPYFSHTNNLHGLDIKCSAFIFDNWKVTANPYIDKKDKGFVFSVGYHFGGAKKPKAFEMKKQHRIFYASEKVVKPIVSKPSMVIPFVLPAPTPKAQDEIKNDPILPLPSEVVVPPPPISHPIELFFWWIGK